MTVTYRDYHISHPWYFYLGGPVPSPRAIRDLVLQTGTTGYRNYEFSRLDHQPEPQRSAAIREAQEVVKAELRKDFARYRQCVLELHRHRETQDFGNEPRSCDDIHTNLSLKVAHMINGFAHLHQLDGMDRQTDLFDLH